VKRRLWLVNQVTTDASLPTVRICRLFYRSDAIQIHLILYLLIDYVCRHSIVQYSLLLSPVLGEPFWCLSTVHALIKRNSFYLELCLTLTGAYVPNYQLETAGQTANQEHSTMVGI
jgi:hypothetical protein